MSDRQQPSRPELEAALCYLTYAVAMLHQAVAQQNGGVSGGDVSSTADATEPHGTESDGPHHEAPASEAPASEAPPSEPTASEHPPNEAPASEAPCDAALREALRSEEPETNAAEAPSTNGESDPRREDKTPMKKGASDSPDPEHEPAPHAEQVASVFKANPKPGHLQGTPTPGAWPEGLPLPPRPPAIPPPVPNFAPPQRGGVQCIRKCDSCHKQCIRRKAYHRTCACSFHQNLWNEGYADRHRHFKDGKDREKRGRDDSRERSKKGKAYD